MPYEQLQKLDTLIAALFAGVITIALAVFGAIWKGVTAVFNLKARADLQKQRTDSIERMVNRRLKEYREDQRADHQEVSERFDKVDNQIADLTKKLDAVLIGKVGGGG